MKISEYLWLRHEVRSKYPKNEFFSPERLDGEVLAEMKKRGDTKVVSDTTNKEVSITEALRTQWQIEEDLANAFAENRRDDFVALCVKARDEKDQYDAEKEQEELEDTPVNIPETEI